MTEKPIYNTYEDFPPEDLFLYAGVDCLATTGVLNKVFPKIVERRPYTYAMQGKIIQGHAPAIIDFMHDAEMPIHEYVCDMILNGVAYDVGLNRSQADAIELVLPELEDQVFTLLGRKFNPDSGKDLSHLLYHDLGFEPPSFTARNEPSIDGDALASLAETHDLEWLRALAKRNNLASVHRTFFKTYVDDFVKRDGRVHADYLMHGTSSFRLSSVNPNLTQLPNSVTETKLGYSIKSCFTVDPGELMLCCDFSGAEIRVLAFLCKDERLLQALADGVDFHSFSAASMHGIPLDEFVSALNYEGHDSELLKLKKDRKTKRQGAKALTLNCLRLLGVTLVEELGELRGTRSANDDGNPELSLLRQESATTRG